MGQRHWDEIDEQMEREGNALRRRMTSVGQRPGTRHQEETRPELLDRLLSDNHTRRHN